MTLRSQKASFNLKIFNKKIAEMIENVLYDKEIDIGDVCRKLQLPRESC